MNTPDLTKVANMQQVYFLLKVVAHMVGAKPAIARLHMSNCHIYEDQYDLMVNEQLKRSIDTSITPELIITKDIKSVKDIDTWVHTNDFKVKGYSSNQEAIHYPFSE
jgi:thymidylate synthase